MSKSIYVFRDAQLALSMLEEETDVGKFRIIFVAALTLVRSIGHVLKEVDSKNNPILKKKAASLFEKWKFDRVGNSIYWEFIRGERNSVLKEYEIRYDEKPTLLIDGERQLQYTFDENIYCPMMEGYSVGEDCRDILAESLEWWKIQFQELGLIKDR